MSWPATADFEKVLAALRVTIAEVDGYEADDVIGNIVQQAEKAVTAARS